MGTATVTGPEPALRPQIQSTQGNPIVKSLQKEKNWFVEVKEGEASVHQTCS